MWLKWDCYSEFSEVDRAGGSVYGMTDGAMYFVKIKRTETVKNMRIIYYCFTIINMYLFYYAYIEIVKL